MTARVTITNLREDKPIATLETICVNQRGEWLGPAAADVHQIAGPQLRGLGIGIYFFAVNIAAYAIGAPLVGKLNDMLGVERNPGGMCYALLICRPACALSALALWRGSRAALRQ